MYIGAIIAEYNPFHNGHAHHVSDLKAQGCSHVVAVMSPNFVQRGNFALYEKHLRAEAALLGGVDLVLELPLPYALSNATRFAYGGVSVLDALGCVDVLGFGSECGDLALLKSCAQALDEPSVIQSLKSFMQEGHAYPKAMSLAVTEHYPTSISDVFLSPNNTLGIEYLRQLRDTGSTITPLTTLRAGVPHDAVEAVGCYASASHLRSLVSAGQQRQLSPLVPMECMPLYADACQKGDFVPNTDRIERAMMAVLRAMTPDQFSRLPDLSEGIENRLQSAVSDGCTITEIYRLLKTKRYPLSRIRRLIMSAFLGIDAHLSTTPPPYIRVLGSNLRGLEVLAKAKLHAKVPLSFSLAKLRDMGGMCETFALLEAKSTDLYYLATDHVSPCGSDYTTEAIIHK